MTKRKDPKDKLKTGAPSKLNDKTFRQALILAKEGMTEAKICEILEICDKTISNWKNQFPEFLQAMHEAKEYPDELVKRSMHKRATGYTRPVEKLLSNGEIVIVNEEVLPDVTAGKFWLMNRRKEEWREKQDIELSGGPLVAVIKEI